jgi:Holliday junction resolvase RusA-like endonuclease
MAQKRAVVRLSGPLEVCIRLPRQTRGDVSNRIKAVEDYLVSRQVTDDDRFNARVTIERADVVLCEEVLREIDGGIA